MRRESDQEGTVELEERRMRLRDAVEQRPQRSRASQRRSSRTHADQGHWDGRVLGWRDELRGCTVFGAQTATTRLQAHVAAGIGDVAGHGGGLCDTWGAENLQAATGEDQQQD